MTDPVLVWFRQDLRVSDQAALAAAANEGPVVAVYALDDESPGDWRIGGAQRWWLHHSLAAFRAALKAKGVPLILRRGVAAEEVAKVAREIGADRVHALAHQEPWWQAAERALGNEVALCLHPGTRLAEPDCVLTGTGTRYRIFTPFWRALSERMPPPPPHPAPRSLAGHGKAPKSDRLEDWGLLPSKPDWAKAFGDAWTPGEQGATAALTRFLPRLAAYDHDRNLPSIAGSSELSPHLHFGEISPSTIWHRASNAKGEAGPYLRELGWRDFTGNLIDQMPAYGRRNGRPAYDKFPWRRSEKDFEAWTKGRTGYPIVDAGMRQLWTIGWMHNRVRMIAASFLIKHLLIDWRRGERWFWDTLVDADYGNNSVNWQWVAGTGTDSSPFGRIMAPLSQSEKFDAAGYIRRWVPELAKLGDDVIHDPHAAGCAPENYPPKLVEHEEGRARALEAARAVRS